MTTHKKPAQGLAGLGRLRLFGFCAVFLALSALAPYLIYQQLDSQAPSLDGRWLSWPFLLSCAALLTAYYSFDGLRLLYILKSLGHSVPTKAMAPLVFINIFVSNVTPMATGGGFAQVWYLQRHGISIGVATAATSLRTLQAVLFIFVPAPLVLLFLPQLAANPLGEAGALYLALFAAAYVALFGIILLRIGWMIALVELSLWPLTRLRLLEQARVARWRFRIRREMIRFSRSFRGFFTGPRLPVCLSLMFTALFLLTLFSFPALLLWGLGYSIDYLTSLALLLVTTFIMYFAPTPGAAGVAEGAFGLFFAGLVESGDLILTIVAWRFLTIHLGMLIGLPLTLRAIVTAKGTHAQ